MRYPYWVNDKGLDVEKLENKISYQDYIHVKTFFVKIILSLEYLRPRSFDLSILIIQIVKTHSHPKSGCKRDEYQFSKDIFVTK